MKYPYPNSVNWKRTNEGGIRRLRLGEINLASSLYGFSIHYNQVWIHLESYLPSNLQNSGQAMTPNGEMWFRPEKYEHDFSIAPVKSQHLFLHEMMHVWQHQKGMWVRFRGSMSWAADYTYNLDKPNLLNYSLEQQASIASDYWLLKHYGFYGHSSLYMLRDYNPCEPDNMVLAKYDKVLGSFPS